MQPKVEQYNMLAPQSQQWEKWQKLHQKKKKKEKDLMGIILLCYEFPAVGTKHECVVYYDLKQIRIGQMDCSFANMQ